MKRGRRGIGEQRQWLMPLRDVKRIETFELDARPSGARLMPLRDVKRIETAVS